MRKYRHTMNACFVSFVLQAILVNFAPLLFLTFQREFSLTLTQVTSLITVNFITQLIVDALSIKYASRIGPRRLIILAHGAICCGFVGLAIFPAVFPSAYLGLLCASMCYAVGGGLIEVLVNPVVEACPVDNKAAAISLLHSFYCWGVVLVVVVSTTFFALFGIENWRIMACFWALVALANGIYFAWAPRVDIAPDGDLSIRKLVTNRIFWIFMIIMICAGAAEQSMGQWVSTFAEDGLKVSKTIGDLAGPCLFAVTMGISRIGYSKLSEKVDLSNYMVGSGILCVISYCFVAFFPSPIVSFVACAICGFSVGIMWPGTVSMGAAKISTGGTAMFAFFALGGDIGCSLGPTVVGLVFDQTNLLQMGFAAAIVFPLLLIVCTFLIKKAH